MFSTAPKHESCTTAITAYRNILGSIGQALLHELSARTRRCRDMLFNARGYRRLQSCFAAHSEEEKVAKAEEVAVAKERLLYYFDNGNLHCSHWRLSAVTDFSLPGCQSALNYLVLDEQRDYLCLFSNEAEVETWNEFLGGFCRKKRHRVV